MPLVEVVSTQTGLWNPNTHRFTLTAPALTPGNTLLLVLTSQGAYSNVDSGPLAGQYDTTINLFTQNIAQFRFDQTRCFTDGQIASWPDPAVVGPYLATIEPGTVGAQEVVTVTNVVPADFYIDVIRGATPVTHPRNSLIFVNDPLEIIDSGNQPPLLYVPGDPTAAPARTAAWWAQVTTTGTLDPSFALWQSRYWQSAPTLPVGHPLWTTLSMLARRVDGTEIDNGLIDPLTGAMIVEMQGAWPTDYTFLHNAYLLQLTPTIEILPIPEFPPIGASGDLMQSPDPLPTVPPDPRYPPFGWVYPPSSWTRWVSSLGMNGVDIFLPVLLSQLRYPLTGPGVRPGIEGFRDVTGDATDNPVPFAINGRAPAGGGLYTVMTQFGLNVFQTTHDPNPIIDEVVRVGDVDPTALLTSGHAGPIGIGASRVPVVGQDPWWELADTKAGALELGSGGTVQPPTGDVRTDDVMLVVAQSDGLAAPADPEGWTRIDALCGPNAYSHQEVTVSTTLASDALAGSAFVTVNLTTLMPLPPIPFPLVCDGEAMTATTAVVGGDGNVQLGVGSVGSDHLAGAPVTMQGDPPIVARDQYVAAWWKIAAGPPPVDGVPSFATETGPTITFPDASSCSAQLFAVVCDLTNPFSQISAGLDAVSRADFPAPALSVTAADMLPEDGITLRLGFGLLMGENRRQSTPVTSIQSQDILYDTWAITEIDPSPILAWQEVGADTVGVALYVMFRGARARPAYEKIDGHYAPTFLNHGVLPPCAGAGVMSSTDYRAGFGITHINAGVFSSHVYLQREGLVGSTAYLHAWVWSDTTVPEVTGYLYQRSAAGAIINQQTWFATDPTDIDNYIDPPGDPQFYTGDNPYCLRIEVAAGTRGDGYLGINAWSEEFCQDPAVASFGLVAGFRFRGAAPPASPSNQQPSIVG